MPIFATYTEAELASRLEKSKNHFTHPYAILGDIDLLGPDYPLLNEYLVTVLYTAFLCVTMLILFTVLDYWVFYHWKKDVFIPLK